MKKIISLCGPMGSGKSTCGKILSKKLGLKFWESDLLIEEECRLTIPQIFEKFGEEFFRMKEVMVIDRLLKRGDHEGVLSLGGGSLMNQETCQLILEHTTLIYLKTPLVEIAQRIFNEKQSRPLIKAASNVNDVLKVLEQLNSIRETQFELAPIIVHCHYLNPEQIGEKIMHLIS